MWTWKMKNTYHFGVRRVDEDCLKENVNTCPTPNIGSIQDLAFYFGDFQRLISKSILKITKREVQRWNADKDKSLVIKVETKITIIIKSTFKFHAQSWQVAGCRYRPKKRIIWFFADELQNNKKFLIFLNIFFLHFGRCNPLLSRPFL